MQKQIYCCGCKKDTQARLTDGSEVYPYRTDLHLLPFWICDTCKSFVGCHHKSNNRLRPLGVIATQDVKNKRVEIHFILDPMWKSGKYRRDVLYRLLSKKICRQYHTAEIRSVEEAEIILSTLKAI